MSSYPPHAFPPQPQPYLSTGGPPGQQAAQGFFRLGSAPLRPPRVNWSLATALGLLALFVVAQLLLSLLLQLPWLQGLASGLLLGFALVVLGSHLLGWAGVWWLTWRPQRRFAGALGLQGRATAWALVLAVLLGLLAQAANLGVLRWFPPPTDVEMPFLRLAESGPWGMAMLAFTAVILAPALEEVLFRGILQPALRRWGATLAIVLTALLFALLHGVQLRGYWPPLLSIFIIGLILGWLRERTHSLYPSILCHAVYNGLAVGLLLLTFALSDAPHNWG